MMRTNQNIARKGQKIMQESMKEIMTVIGARLRMIRVEKEMNQCDVAKMMGVSQTHLSNIESGKNNLSLPNLLKMKKIYGCTIDEIFVDLDKKEENSVEKAISKLTLDDLRDIAIMLKKNKPKIIR